MFAVFKNISLFFLAFFFVGSAWSLDYFDSTVTENEKVVFSYYRVGGVTPNFDDWIKDSRTYSALPENRREDYLLQEQLRLGRGFGAHDADTALLNIEAPVFVKFMVDENGEQRVLFTFYRHDQAYIPTFDYPYLKQEGLSLIVNHLGSFAMQPKNLW